jgi:hypothetical protein
MNNDKKLDIFIYGYYAQFAKILNGIRNFLSLCIPTECSEFQ